MSRNNRHPMTSRPKPPTPGTEDAGAELNLGEFQHVDTLTLSEAALVIKALVEKRRAEHRNVHDNEMLNQTIDYLDHFARFKRKENVEAVERLLSSCTRLHKFERAQLGSLVCFNAEEAKTLIPSLQDKISDEELQTILDQLDKLQSSK